MLATSGPCPDRLTQLFFGLDRDARCTRADLWAYASGETGIEWHETISVNDAEQPEFTSGPAMTTNEKLRPKRTLASFRLWHFLVYQRLPAIHALQPICHRHQPPVSSIKFINNRHQLIGINTFTF